jgi:hypothetical protein
MATNEVLELYRTNYDDLKRNLNYFEWVELETYKQLFERIDEIFDDVRKQIYHGELLGSSRFIPYEVLYHDNELIQRFPQVLTYYKDKVYELLDELRMYYMDLYIVGNFDGLEDGAVLETTRIFDVLYNLIWGSNFETFYVYYYDDIRSVLQMDDYDTAKQIFEKYTGSIISDISNTIQKLLIAKKQKDRRNELLRTYLSLKKIDLKTIDQLLDNIEQNRQLLTSFYTWLNTLIESLKRTLIYYSRAADSITATLNNPDKAPYFRDLLLNIGK